MSGTVLFLYFLISAHKIGSSPLSKVLGGNPLCFSPPLPSSQVERKKNVSDWQVRGIPRAIGPGPLLGKVTSGLWLPPLSSLLGACSLAPCSPQHCLSSWGSSLAAQAVSDGKHNSQQVEQEDYLSWFQVAVRHPALPLVHLISASFSESCAFPISSELLEETDKINWLQCPILHSNYSLIF